MCATRDTSTVASIRHRRADYGANGTASDRASGRDHHGCARGAASRGPGECAPCDAAHVILDLSSLRIPIEVPALRFA
jgi:hypothetical protein